MSKSDKSNPYLSIKLKDGTVKIELFNHIAPGTKMGCSRNGRKI